MSSPHSDIGKRLISTSSDVSKNSIRKNAYYFGSLLLQTTTLPSLVNAAVSVQEKKAQGLRIPRLQQPTLSSASKAFDYTKPPYVNGDKIFLDGIVSKHIGDSLIITSPIINPLTKERTIIGKMAQMNKADTLKAIESSTKAWNNGQGEWPQMAASGRIRIVENIIKSLKEKRQHIIHVLAWEICKTVKDATTEFDRTIEFMEATVIAYRNMNNNGNSNIDNIDGSDYDGNSGYSSNNSNAEDNSSSSSSTDGSNNNIKSQWSAINGIYATVKRAAIGIMLCLGPYNYPFNETYATLIPALLLGNVAILKLPTIGGLAHILTQEVYAKHLPTGVLNFVPGSGRVTVGPMMKTGKIDMLAFIGSSQAADSIIKQHPNPHRLTTYFGLEAKNVAIVMPDADIENAVNEIILGTLSYNGQRCTAIKLTMVHISIIKLFLEKFQIKLNALKLGLPWQENVSITSLPEGTKKIDYLQSLITDAVNKGAKVLNEKQGGGKVVSSILSLSSIQSATGTALLSETTNSGNDSGNSSSSLMVPALVYPVTADMRLWKEEQFGPVIPVTTYSDTKQIIDYFATTPYGQQAAIFTQNTAAAVTNRGEAGVGTIIDILSTTVGRINVNTQCGRSPDSLPFSGRRSSALGTLSVTDGLRAFSIPTVVAGKDNKINRNILDNLSTEKNQNTAGSSGSFSKFLSRDRSSSGGSSRGTPSVVDQIINK